MSSRPSAPSAAERAPVGAATAWRVPLVGGQPIPPPAGSSYLTVGVGGTPAHKTFVHRGGAYSAERLELSLFHRFFTTETTGLDEVFDAAHSLGADAGPNAYLLRGAFAATTDGPHRRIASPTSPDRAIWDVPSNILVLDLDGTDAPAGVASSSGQALEAVIESFPAWLRTSDAAWHWSSSAGLSRKVRGHYIVWLSEPVTGAEAARLLSLAGVPSDPSVCRPAQPLYVLDPHFVGGPGDPIRERWVWRPGESPVAHVPPELLAAVRAPAAAPRRTRAAVSLPPGNSQMPIVAHPPLEQRLRRAELILLHETPAVEGQRGRRSLFIAALKVVRGLCVPEADARDLLARVYSPRCLPPWSEAEIGAAVASAITTGRVPWKFLL
jgi:hypothetical protein